jgi:hypothetical protein
MVGRQLVDWFPKCDLRPLKVLQIRQRRQFLERRTRRSRTSHSAQDHYHRQWLFLGSPTPEMAHNPQRVRGFLAHALQEMGWLRWETGHRQQALRLLRQALPLYARAAELNPASWRGSIRCFTATLHACISGLAGRGRPSAWRSTPTMRTRRPSSHPGAPDPDAALARSDAQSGAGRGVGEVLIARHQPGHPRLASRANYLPVGGRGSGRGPDRRGTRETVRHDGARCRRRGAAGPEGPPLGSASPAAK